MTPHMLLLCLSQYSIETRLILIIATFHCIKISCCFANLLSCQPNLVMRKYSSCFDRCRQVLDELDCSLHRMVLCWKNAGGLQIQYGWLSCWLIVFRPVLHRARHLLLRVTILNVMGENEEPECSSQRSR